MARDFFLERKNLENKAWKELKDDDEPNTEKTPWDEYRLVNKDTAWCLCLEEKIKGKHLKRTEDLWKMEEIKEAISLFEILCDTIVFLIIKLGIARIERSTLWSLTFSKHNQV